MSLSRQVFRRSLAVQAGGTLHGASTMAVFGPKQTNVPFTQRFIDNYINGSDECLAAQTRDTSETTLGPHSYWSGYAPAFYYEHSFTPIFHRSPAQLAGSEYFHQRNLWYSKFVKSWIFMILGVVLVLKEFWTKNYFPLKRLERIWSDQLEILPYFLRNEEINGFCNQLRWAEKNGFPTGPGPFNAAE